MKSVEKDLTTTTLLLPNNLSYLILICFLPFFFSCKNNSSSVEASTTDNSSIVEEDENVVHIPEDFPAFYANFHVDPEFQLEHVQFPLSGKSETEKWKLEDWEFHQPFNNPDEFKRDIDNLGGIITETIIDNNGMFFIVRRFAKLGDEWNLIYYNIGTNMDGFVPDEQ